MNINLQVPMFENIEIKCKTGSKENKENTTYFINELSLVYDYAARFTQGQGMEAIAQEFNQKSKILFDLLLEAGHYDKYK